MKKLALALAALALPACATHAVKTADAEATYRRVASDDSRTYDFRCDETTATQPIAEDGKEGAVAIQRDRTVGSRTSAPEGDGKVYHSSATVYDENGAVNYTYTAVRHLQSKTLANGTIRETSYSQNTSTVGGVASNGGSQSIDDYQAQPDGTLKLVKSYVNGIAENDGSTGFRMTTPDGVIYEVYSDHHPFTRPESDGSSTKTLQYKSLCVLTPRK